MTSSSHTQDARDPEQGTAEDAASPRPAEPVEYDVVVLGAGPVGENLADRVRAAGLSVAVVESELAGGECSYWACMPSKALLRPVIARADARRLPGLKDVAPEGPDAAAVLARRNSFASDWKDDGQAQWLDGIGADLHRGHGRLDGTRRVTVTGDDGRTELLVARHAVAVCTGSRAVVPPLPGVEEARVWTSREATSADHVPESLVVVGGGVVGCEMATAWQALGAQVTLLARGEGLLHGMEPFAGEFVAEALRSAGAVVHTGASVTAVRREGGSVHVSVDGAPDVTAAEVLFATGRAPRIDDLGLESVGLETDGGIDVDDTCRVHGSDWLYVVGDANGRALLTHQGKYQARIAGSALAARASGVPLLETDRWGAHSATADHEAVTQVVFTDPEVGSVGPTLEELKAAGRPVRAVDIDLGGVAGAALYGDDYQGRARMIVDTGSERVVGVTFVGPGVGELVHSAAVAVAGEVPLERLWHAVPAYPTISEVWLRLLEAYRDGE